MTVWLGLLHYGHELGRQLPAPGYRRVETSPDDFDDAVDGVVTNAHDLAFPIATGHWPDVDAFGLFDQCEGGALLLEGPLTTAKPVEAGDQVYFAAGALTVSFEDPPPASLTLTIELRD